MLIIQSETRYDESAYPIINAGTATGWQDPNTNLRGNATTARVWDSSTNIWIESHAQFDNFGNARKTWDAKGNSSEVEFSSVYQFAYPTKTISVVPDPSGQRGSNVPFESTTVYDFYTGLVLSTTDANGQTSSVEYNDILLRPTKVIPPSGGAQTITEYGDIPGNLFVRSKTQIDATNWSESTAYFDGLGRTFKTQKKDSQGDVFTETIYDNLGRVKQVTNPFRIGETKQWSTSNYDVVGRVKEVIAPDGTKVESDYGISTVPNFVGTFVIGTDQAGKQGRSITNALGQLVRVDEPDDNGNLGSLASPTQPTFYNYSPQGQMVKVTQGVQNRFFLYDGLGRLIRVRQPEQDVNANLALNDAVTGNNQWTAAFSYDISGNLLTATDAKGVTITSSYDNANRVLTRTYSDGTSPANYFYENPNIAFSKGKLTRSENAISANQILAIDNLGRVTASRQTTDGNNFDSSYLYNISGALVEETYPTGRKVKNTFEADGDLSKIETQQAGQAYQTRAQNFAYNSSGAISQIQIGNGLWETAQFNNRLQVTQLGLGTSANDTSVWKLNYEFGELDTNGNVNVNKNNGNIAKQTVTSAAGIFTQTYRYDSLERLKEAKETSGGNQTWIQNFAYDRYGNRIGQNQTVGGITSSGTPTVDVNTNRFTTGQGYVYDFAGNIVQDNQGRQFIFNGDNKQVEVRNSQNQIIGQYFYDADGKRIKKVTNDEITVFVYSGGKLAAEYSAVTNGTLTSPTPQTQYFGTDMLQSLRIITNQNAQIVSQRDFMPFGEDVPRANYGSDNNRFKFTTYQKDNETGLDFAEARYYNNVNGRFTAVDPLLASGKSADPQTFNRYIYSLNSPLTLVDSNGEQTGKPVYVKQERNKYGGITSTYSFKKIGRQYKGGRVTFSQNGVKVIVTKDGIRYGRIDSEVATKPQKPPVGSTGYVNYELIKSIADHGVRKGLIGGTVIGGGGALGAACVFLCGPVAAAGGGGFFGGTGLTAGSLTGATAVTLLNTTPACGGGNGCGGSGLSPELSRQLGDIYSKYPAQDFKCECSADAARDAFQNAGMNAEILELGAENGDMILINRSGKIRFSENFKHEVVRSGDRYYDALTGADGATWNEYVELWDKEQVPVIRNTNPPR